MATSATAQVSTLKNLSVDANAKVPLYQQLAVALKQALADGTLPPAAALPGPGELAASLGISRNTVRRAYGKLSGEGLICPDPAGGFLVPDRDQTSLAGSPPTQASTSPAPAAPDETPKPSPFFKALSAAGATASEGTAAAVAPAPKPATPPVATAPVVFSRAAALEQIDLARLHPAGPARPFRPGFPDTAEFPLAIWEQLRSRLLRERSGELLAFTGTFGYLPLREAVAARLRQARGVKCSPEQVIITSGALPSLNLIIDTLVSPGDPVGIEEPGYYGAKAAFLRAGARVTPMLVDEEGLIVPDPKRKNPPALVYATPTTQFPLGAALALPRRLALLEYAAQTGSWVVEDDSDGDFCYAGQPIPSLQGADSQNRVLYFGTTGRSLFPSLEIGYLVVPFSLMEHFTKTKEISGGQPSVIDQATLALFLSEGHFDRHLRRMNVIYHQRLHALTQAVHTDLAGYIDLEPAQAGLHAVGWLARGLEEEFVANAAQSAGIDLPVLSRFGRTALIRPGVVFGFASYSERVIRHTVHLLGRALRARQSQHLKALPPPPSSRMSVWQRLLPGRRD